MRVPSLSIVGAIATLLLGVYVFAVAPVAAQPQDTSRALLDETLATIDSLRHEGRFQEAQNRLTALREEHPERVDILWRLVFTWADLGKATSSEAKRRSLYQKALDAAETALASDSTNARAHFAMAVAEGRVALNAGTRERIERSRAVKRHADRAIALDSTLPGAYHVRGRWHREVASLGFFQRAIVRTVYGGLPEASYEQAVRDFQQAIDLENEIFHHLELGRTYLAMDQSQKAREQFRTVLELPRSDPFDPVYKKEAREHLEDLG